MNANPSKPETGKSDAGGWVLVLVGLFWLAITTTLAFLQQGKAQDLDDARAVRNLTAGEVAAYQRHVDRRDDFRLTCTALFAGAGVLLVGGGLLYLFDSPRPGAAPPSEGLLPIVTPDELGAAWVGSF